MAAHLLISLEEGSNFCRDRLSAGVEARRVYKCMIEGGMRLRGFCKQELFTRAC